MCMTVSDGLFLITCTLFGNRICNYQNMSLLNSQLHLNVHVYSATMFRTSQQSQTLPGLFHTLQCYLQPLSGAIFKVNRKAHTGK